MDTETLYLPEQWACALLNSYPDGFQGFDPNEEYIFKKFVDSVFEEHGKCQCIDVKFSEGMDFRRYHDATVFGSLSCYVAKYTFDVTPLTIP